jgi:tetratricopeptide (TPR) repeat protein
MGKTSLALCLAIAEQIGDHRLEYEALGALGSAHHGRGDGRRALAYHERALRTAETWGMNLDLWDVFGWLGRDYRLLGDARRAVAYHQRALASAEQVGTAWRKV